jgi:hypothetical protein
MPALLTRKSMVIRTQLKPHGHLNTCASLPSASTSLFFHCHASREMTSLLYHAVSRLRGSISIYFPGVGLPRPRRVCSTL